MCKIFAGVFTGNTCHATIFCRKKVMLRRLDMLHAINLSCNMPGAVYMVICVASQMRRATCGGLWKRKCVLIFT